MYDAVTQDSLVSAGWIRQIGLNDIKDPEDIFPFALDGSAVEGRLYGIPVFLCGNFLIYDQQYQALAAAEHLTDLAGLSGILVISSEKASSRHQYTIEVIADKQGAGNPDIDDGSGDEMLLIDSLAVEGHKTDKSIQVAMAYDSGIGWGYIGYSESMRLLKNRGETTRIKSVSFSDRPDIHRLYMDAVAVTGGVEGQKYEKCLELMNLMASADVLTALSVQNGDPQYLLPARKAPYRVLSADFPRYAQLEELAGFENSHVILTP